jgi:DNA-binding transcriptional LysR family regulator
MAIRNLSMRQLQLFAEVAKRQSFVRTAEAMHLTPPAVTMQIKELEAAIEQPLLDSRGRSV